MRYNHASFSLNKRVQEGIIERKKERVIMKAVGFVGSKFEHSQCMDLGNRLKGKLQKKGIDFELYDTRENVLQDCMGCQKCFDKGICPLDQRDCMRVIRRKMLDADLIVWFSPVYLNNVSGTMKTYLDRIGSWVHTMHLSGKIGVTVTVTDQSGQEFVSYYLKSMLQQMGCNVIGEYKVVKIENLKLERIIERIVADIMEAVSNHDQYKSTYELETCFRVTRERFVNSCMEQYRNECFEIDYWYSSGMAFCESYQEVLDNKKAKHRGDFRGK